MLGVSRVFKIEYAHSDHGSAIRSGLDGRRGTVIKGLRCAVGESLAA
jgi:hypothetical protein